MSSLLLYLVAAVAVMGVVQLILSLRRSADFSQVSRRFDEADRQFERQDSRLREEMKGLRDELGQSLRDNREENANSFKAFNDSVLKLMSELGNAQKSESQSLIENLGRLTASVEEKLESLRKTVEDRLQLLQDGNLKKLEEMRQTVDEKLQSTLDKRLGESFKQVSERLEQVHKGLGEMKILANGVGDLRKVLTNVKTRGFWGEIQLAALLEQILTREQYATNVKTKLGSDDLVEFAIKLPGREEGGEGPVWLPVDSKFPMDDYQRLVAAQEAGDIEAVNASGGALEARIKSAAKDIALKYLDPPHTTDFAIMFLPVEGLYAEVLRRSGLVEALQRDHRVSVAGPTTFAALLNSLQMGFKTLAIEKRSSEVWALLGAVKSQFGKFGEMLDKVKKNIDQASKSIESAATRSKTIERKLRAVEELPAADAEGLLGRAGEIAEDDAGETGSTSMAQ